MVCSIAFGENVPVRNTLSPRRVTSRSSCRVRRRLPLVLAILRRTELEPISTAAKVGISQAEVYMARAAGDGAERLAGGRLAPLNAAWVSSKSLLLHVMTRRACAKRLRTSAWIV